MADEPHLRVVIDAPPAMRRWDRPLANGPHLRVAAESLPPGDDVVLQDLQGWNDPYHPGVVAFAEAGVLPGAAADAAPTIDEAEKEVDDSKEHLGEFDVDNDDDGYLKAVEAHSEANATLKLAKLLASKPEAAAWVATHPSRWRLSSLWWHLQFKSFKAYLKALNLTENDASWFAGQVEVRPSNIPGAGLGLFATRDIPLKPTLNEALEAGMITTCLGRTGNESTEVDDNGLVYTIGENTVRCNKAVTSINDYFCADCRQKADKNGNEDDVLVQSAYGDVGSPGMRFVGVYMATFFLHTEPEKDRSFIDAEEEKDYRAHPSHDYNVEITAINPTQFYLTATGREKDTYRKDFYQRKFTGATLRGPRWISWAAFPNDHFLYKDRPQTRKPHLMFSDTGMVWQVADIKKNDELDIDYGKAYTED